MLFPSGLYGNVDFAVASCFKRTSSQSVQYIRHLSSLIPAYFKTMWSSIDHLVTMEAPNKRHFSNRPVVVNTVSKWKPSQRHGSPFQVFFLLAGCPSYSWRPNKQLHSVSPPSYKLYDNNNHMSSSALVLKPIFWQMHRTWPLTLASSICGLFPLVGTFFPFFQYKPTKSSLPQTSLLTLIVGLRLRVFF